MGLDRVALRALLEDLSTLMGTNCSLLWREANEKERLWVVEPSHPVMEGIPPYFELEAEEMYGERFDVPTPEHLLMVSWFQGGEVFRSCATWQRGHGKIVYFRPGHEEYPTYRNEHVLRVIANSMPMDVRVEITMRTDDAPNSPALEWVPGATDRAAKSAQAGSSSVGSSDGYAQTASDRNCWHRRHRSCPRGGLPSCGR